MNRKTAIVNVYNFIRMSHTEPSRFLVDDFDTIRRELILVKQYGFPGTYALKYDALMEPRYQRLLMEYLDENDEISAWWEITEPLCRRAGVRFRDHDQGEEYDDRVDSAYCVGYTPQERRQLVDAYMADFYSVFGRLPRTIGSWVLDSVTLAYARERYGLEGAAICRDQMGTDGFTLWGGWPNGVYYPSKKNEFIPAQTPEGQLDVPVFRLLGPDPIYNFEADVRSGLQGVYTLEPSWLTGRDPKWLRWFFSRLTDEPTLGISYAQVGQENNFLWENIRPGLEPQLALLEELARKGAVRVETMADSAEWFRRQYRLTPPETFQASFDWDETRKLGAMWYAGACYRLGFLTEQGRLRIRDLFIYDEAYAARYFTGPMKGTKSISDALPVCSPQLWGMGETNRPYLRLTDAAGREPEGKASFTATDGDTASAVLTGPEGERIAAFSMDPQGFTLTGEMRLAVDYLPSYEIAGERILLRHNDFSYGLRISRGKIVPTGEHTLVLIPDSGALRVDLREQAPESCLRTTQEVPAPAPVQGVCRPVPPLPPRADPKDRVFDWGSVGTVRLSAHDAGVIRYTLDGTKPGADAPVYTQPLTLRENTRLRTALFLPDGSRSETAAYDYFFGFRNIRLSSPTRFDPRPVFRGNGISDLLQDYRANTDFLCGRWRGTLENLDVTGVLPGIMGVKTVSVGFLSHHRGGIVYPEQVELYGGPDAQHMTLMEIRELPCAPGPREICRMDVVFRVDKSLGAFRIVAKRYEKMPQWCCYRGARNVFTMADTLILTPAEEQT